MTRRDRIPAAECKIPGWYRSRTGRVLQLVKERNSRWGNPPRRCPDGYIPYRAPGNLKSRDPVRRVAVYGFLPPSYLLLEINKPRWA